MFVTFFMWKKCIRIVCFEPVFFVLRTNLVYLLHPAFQLRELRKNKHTQQCEPYNYTRHFKTIV